MAPDFRGTDVNGRIVALSEMRGRAGVVFFYPKDGTPGCTTEACAFRDAWKAYTEAGAFIFGVSRDSAERHQEFAKEHKLPFPLVADESGEIARRYGVGSFLGMSNRVTFVIDGSGAVAHVFRDVDPGVHAKDVLEVLRRVGPSTAGSLDGRTSDGRTSDGRTSDGGLPADR
jgi:peroxiredoxin Q/BCP